MSVRTLSKPLQVKAIAELNENPNRIETDVKHIKEWLKKQPHLNPRPEDQLIVTYLRSCKYSLEKTKLKLDSRYTLRSMLPEFFSNRDPFDKDIQAILEAGVILPLKYASPDSPLVILLRPGVVDAATTKIETFFKLNLMINDIIVQEDDQCVICGVVMFLDITGMTMAHMAQMNVAVVKKSMTYMQQAHPTRPKEIHFYNMASFFDTLIGTIKSFMKEKIQRRIYTHNTNRIEDMYQYIPKSILPKEYGGDAGPVQDLIDYWKKKVEDYADWYVDDYQYVSNESKRIGKPKTANDVLGIEGSFRKLDVD